MVTIGNSTESGSQLLSTDLNRFCSDSYRKADMDYHMDSCYMFL